MLCMVAPMGILIEVNSSFFLSIKTPSQTIQVSSKAYGFLDVGESFIILMIPRGLYEN